jgi:hypothetical protein
MRTMSDPTSGVERLGQVRAWFRRQRRDHSWFAEALRAKGDEFNDLVVKHLAAKNAAQSDLFDRAARLLKKGRLGDPECLGPTAGRSQRLVIACPCDDALAAELADWRTGTNMPPALRKRCARLALQQLIATGAIAPGKGDRESSRGRAPTSKATQVVKIPIVLTRPKRERANPDPRSLDLDHLRQFTGEASIAIASHWLEVLAHAGSIQRRLPEAARTGEALVDNMLALVVAKERANLGAADASLNPEMLTPDIAEEFQEQVDAWAREEAARRGEAWACSTVDEGGSEVASGSPSSPSNHPTSDGLEDKFYLPSVFPCKMAARVRMAARPGRKGRRVRVQLGPNGEKLYSLKDCMQWWPHDFKGWSLPAT